MPEHQFIRIHRSYVIATDKIEKIGRQELTVGGKAIPVGASYERQLQEIRAKIKGAW